MENTLCNIHARCSCVFPLTISLEPIQRLHINLFHMTFSFDVVNCIVWGGDMDDQNTSYVLATKATHVAYLN